MIEVLESVIGDPNLFLKRIFELLERANIQLSELPELDHIAYRTESHEKYEILKKELTPHGEIIAERILRDRPILILKLHRPLNYKGYDIPYLELMAPASDNTFKDGLEHAEFVIRINLTDFMQMHPGLPYNTNLLTREINPELILEYKKGTAIKFHNRNIAEVMKSKENGVKSS